MKRIHSSPVKAEDADEAESDENGSKRLSRVTMSAEKIIDQDKI